MATHFRSSLRQRHVLCQVVPSIIFFSATMSVLYYYGIMQMAVGVIARLVTVTLGTGPWESMHAALSVFMGWVCSLQVVSLLLHFCLPMQYPLGVFMGWV